MIPLISTKILPSTCSMDTKRITRGLFLAVFVVLVIFSFQVAGRICFLCDSRNEPCSEDSVNGTRTATCSEGNEFCEVVKDGRHGETRFYRDCVNKCDKEFVNWEKDGEEYCKMCCDNDLCNVGRCGSPVALTLSGTLIVLNAIVAFRCMFVFA